MNVYFFLGKGGVGKTTTSAAFGTGLSRNGHKVIVVSIDPAHNLGDAFATTLSDKVLKIDENLYATEVDIERMTREYLDNLSKEMQHTYRYLTAMNLDKYFNILKLSPGIEEYATLESIRKYIGSNDYDTVIFDTPPTGITLRVLAMPRLSVLWAERLIAMRKAILSRRKMIENVKGKFEAEIEREKISLTSDEKEDDIMQELVKYRWEMIGLNKLFSSTSCEVHIVTMAEDLALLETERILKSLSTFGLTAKTIYLNKFMKIENPPEEIAGKIDEQEHVFTEMREKFKHLSIREIPLLKASPRGLKDLLSLYESYIAR
jgi:arsenite-transporting ATPase